LDLNLKKKLLKKLKKSPKSEIRTLLIVKKKRLNKKRKLCNFRNRHNRNRQKHNKHQNNRLKRHYRAIVINNGQQNNKNKWSRE